MSELLERVRGVRELPLFPLPLVLFPGAPLPLHIFEPRYRQMLRDVRAGNDLFGVSYFDASKATGEDRPPVGHVGCAAEVMQVEPLEDGRSNIMTVGIARYRVTHYVDSGDPYLVAAVEFFEDEPEDERELSARAKEVSNLFVRIARAVRKLNDERAGLPDLPEVEPERLSFLIAAAMEIEPDVKQQMIETRSGLARLAQIRDLLARAVGNYEERARVHAVAKTNGHAGKKVGLE